MKTPDSPLPPASDWWDTVVVDMWNDAVEHWWIFLIAAVIVIIIIAPRKK